MKKRTVLILIVLCSIFALASCSKKSGSSENKSFTPKKDVEWIVTSKPGGGSDIFTQQIKDTMKTNGISDANVVINYVTDGGGEVGRLQVSMTNKAKADYTLLTFNSGDLMPMVANTDNRIENFTPIAMMAIDKHLLYVGEKSKYTSFQEVLDALKNGQRIVIAGSKGDDIETFNKLIKELDVPESQLSYISNDSTSGAITSLLGGHVDLCMAKPASATQYVEAGKMKPIVALSDKRFTSELLKDTPSITEFGYESVDVANWRSVIGPKEMSAEAAAYWSECFKKVSESDAWLNGYIALYELESSYMTLEETKAYMEQYQTEYLAGLEE